MENIFIFGMGAVIVGLLVVKMIFGSHDAKPEELEWSKSRKDSKPEPKPKATRAKKETMNRFAEASAEHRADSRAQRIRNSARPEGKSADASPWAKGNSERFAHKSLRGYLFLLYGTHLLAFGITTLLGGGLMLFTGVGMYFFTQYLHNNSSTQYLSPSEKNTFNSISAATKMPKGYFVRICLPVIAFWIFVSIVLVAGVGIFLGSGLVGVI